MFYRMCWWTIALHFNFIFRTKVINRKNFIKKGKAVGICNHFSNTDVPLVAVKFFRQFHFMAKKELFEGKKGGKLYTRLGAIPVDREKMDLSTYKAAMNVLKNDELLMLFPEGTRNPDEYGRLQDMKPGAVLFAIKGKAPIVPMIYYRKPKAFRKNYLMVGDPIDLSEYYGKKLSEEDMESINKMVSEKMQSLQEELIEKVEYKKRKKLASKEMHNDLKTNDVQSEEVIANSDNIASGNIENTTKEDEVVDSELKSSVESDTPTENAKTELVIDDKVEGVEIEESVNHQDENVECDIDANKESNS